MKKVPVIKKDDDKQLYAVQLFEFFPKVWIALSDFTSHPGFIGNFYPFEKPIPANQYWLEKSLLGRNNVLKESPFKFIGELELKDEVMCNYCIEQKQNKKGVFHVLKPVLTPPENCVDQWSSKKLYSIEDLKKMLDDGTLNPLEKMKTNCNAK